jgi:two-component system OmpR family response regulator
MTGTDPIKVIYVNDSTFYGAILRAGLAVYDIDVLHLSRGDESLIEELSQSRYDAAEAIILDVNLGELNGLQVARRLRADGDGRPIMVMSAEDKPDNSGLMATQAMFVSMPFDFDRISGAIKKFTGRE